MDLLFQKQEAKRNFHLIYVIFNIIPHFKNINFILYPEPLFIEILLLESEDSYSTPCFQIYIESRKKKKVPDLWYLN